MRYIFALLVLLLAACAPTAPPVAPTDAPPLTEASPPEEDPQLGEAGEGLFTATVQGDVETTFAGTGSYDCDEGSELLTSGTAGTGNSLVFTLPAIITDGEYGIGIGGDNSVEADLVVAGTSYSADVFGILTLSDAPSAAGDVVSGSFDMNFTDADDNSVNVVGTFDLTADSVCN